MPYKDPEQKKADADYYARNRERIRAQQANAYDPERAREYRRKTQDRRAEVWAAWRKKNLVAELQRNREYRLKNPHVHRRNEGNRRARKLGQFIENVDPQTVYQMHGGRCGICGKFIQGDFHVDHIVPLSKGGRHGYINVQPAHPVCNMRKGSRVG